MLEDKKVSAIVVNWNGRELLSNCLDSIFNQSYNNLEVTVVDCASKDESVPFIKVNYPKAKVIELKQDFGPPYAINMAAREAQGEYVLILNNDVYLPPDLVQEMVAELIKDENCVITPVELNWKNEYVHSGIPEFWIGRYLHKMIPLKGASPFYPSTACCLVTKETLMQNPLNESLFMYEDTEWGWRLHLKKIKIKVLTNSFFLHKGAGTKQGYSPEQAYYVGRVALTTCLICFRLPTFVLVSPILALEHLRQILRFVRRKHLGSIKSYLKGVLHFFVKMKFWLEKRMVVQSQRRISDLQVLRLMIGSIDFEKKAKKHWMQCAPVLKPTLAEVSFKNEAMPVQ